MKDNKQNIFNNENFLTVLIALLLGLFLGVMWNTRFSTGVKTYFHDIYIKINPDAKKTSHELIIDRVNKDLPNLPQNSIFEQPEKKENKIILFVKKIFLNRQKDSDIFNYEK